MIEIKYTGATLRKAHGTDACFDIRSMESAYIPPLDARTIKTGLHVDIPAGYVGLVFSRSSQGFKNDVRLANCTGVIDAGYRGEIGVRLTNDGHEGYNVEHGDKIAQLMIVKLPAVEMIQLCDEDFEHLPPTERGERGFGSSGR